MRDSIYKEVAAGKLQYKWGRNVYRKRKGEVEKVWKEDTITLPPACQMIFFLALEAGMRRAEIEAARREWFSVQGDVCLVSIQNVEGEANDNGKVVGEFLTKSREKRIVPIARETWEMLVKLQGHEGPGYFVPRSANKLADEFTWILGWLRTRGIEDEKAIQRLRKEAGSLVARKGGIHKARKFLGHSSITVTNSYYVGADLDPVELKAKSLEVQVAAKWGVDVAKLTKWLEANRKAA